MTFHIATPLAGVLPAPSSGLRARHGRRMPSPNACGRPQVRDPPASVQEPRPGRRRPGRRRLASHICGAMPSGFSSAPAVRVLPECLRLQPAILTHSRVWVFSGCTGGSVPKDGVEGLQDTLIGLRAVRRQDAAPAMALIRGVLQKTRGPRQTQPQGVHENGLLRCHAIPALLRSLSPVAPGGFHLRPPDHALGHCLTSLPDGQGGDELLAAPALFRTGTCIFPAASQLRAGIGDFDTDRGYLSAIPDPGQAQRDGWEGMPDGVGDKFRDDQKRIVQEFGVGISLLQGGSYLPSRQTRGFRRVRQETSGVEKISSQRSVPFIGFTGGGISERNAVAEFRTPVRRFPSPGSGTPLPVRLGQ